MGQQKGGTACGDPVAWPDQREERSGWGSESAGAGRAVMPSWAGPHTDTERLRWCFHRKGWLAGLGGVGSRGPARLHQGVDASCGRSQELLGVLEQKCSAAKVGIYARVAAGGSLGRELLRCLGVRYWVSAVGQDTR